MLWYIPLHGSTGGVGAKVATAPPAIRNYLKYILDLTSNILAKKTKESEF